MSASGRNGPTDAYGRPLAAGGPGPQQHPLDPYQRGPGPQQQQGPPPHPHDTRSKSVSNLPQGVEHAPDAAAAYNRHAQSTSTLPRGGAPPHMMQQQHAPPGGGSSLSQPDLRRAGPADRDDANDYENYPGGGGGGGPGRGMHADPRQQLQPDYVNQRELKSQPPGGAHVLRQAPTPQQQDEMQQHSRVFEWQQRNEMANRQQQQHDQPPHAQGAPGGPPGPYHSLQRALDPQSTLRGPKLNPRAMQQEVRNDPRFAQQQQPPASAHNQQHHPSSPSAHFNQSRGGGYGAPPPGAQQQGPHATYQNIPAAASTAQQRQQQQRLPDMIEQQQRMRTTSPDFPPPPDVTAGDDMRTSGHDEFPPPPQEVMRGQGQMPFNQQQRFNQAPASPQSPYSQQQNYQNLPPVGSHAGHERVRQEGMYTQAPSQAPPPQQPGGMSTSMSAAAGPGAAAGANTLTRTAHMSHSTGSLNRPGGPKPGPAAAAPGPGGKKPPPIAAKPKLNLAEIRKGFTQSPWEREEKEKEKRAREQEAMMARDQQIAELETKPYLSHDEQERLKR